MGIETTPTLNVGKETSKGQSGGYKTSGEGKFNVHDIGEEVEVEM